MDLDKLPIFYYHDDDFCVSVTITDGGRGDFMMWVCRYYRMVERVDKSRFLQEFNYDDLLYLGIYSYDFIEYMKWYDDLRKSLEECERKGEKFEINKGLAETGS